MRRLAIVVIVVVAGVACSGGHHGADGGVVDARLADGAVSDANAHDGGAPLTWVDFSASGCQSFDPAGPTCRVTAPATLRFTAIAPAPVDTTLWSFGDGSPVVTESSPAHVYALPGVYDVTLTVGGEGGTAQVTRAGFVVVRGASLGGACANDAQCGVDLGCACDAATSCPASLAAGFCTAGCSPTNPCAAGGVCADLAAPGAPPGGPHGWRQPLCLPECVGDGDCRPGFACRELRAAGQNGWVKGCFAADLLLDDGASCADASGTLDGSRCASGSCVALGARGVCAASCAGTTAVCASYATCATFAGALGKRCLAGCSADRACDADPWLACEAPDATGAGGFTIGGAADPDGYCAAKRCLMAAECGADGTCVAGFCGP